MQAASPPTGSASQTWLTATSFAILIVALAGLGLLAYDMLAILPRWQMIFDDFGTSLPALTHFLSAIPKWLVIAVLSVAGILLMVKEWISPSRGAALAINVSALLVAVVAHVAFREATTGALVMLIEKVSNGR